MSQFPPLPKDAVPSSYDLRLDLDVVAGSFTGTVAVKVELLKNSRFIVLNGLGLSVDRDASSFTPRESCVVVLNGGDLAENSTVSSSDTCEPSEVKVIAIKYYEEKISLEFGSYLPKGEGVLNLSFNGVISEESKGLFVCCGDNKKMCARRCFPCWDEPVYKAKFKVTMHVPSEYVALSNMPVAEEEVNGNGKILSYQESPNMATYLVLLFVGPEPDSEFIRMRDAMQRALFSPLGIGGTNKTEILLGDVVVNRETEAVSVVGIEDDELYLFSIDEAKKQTLRKEEVVVVSRHFFHGQPVCLVTDEAKLGIICGIDTKVDLAILDGKTIARRDIGTDSLERNRRFFVGDTVVRGSWFGTVQGVELKMKIHQENGFTVPAYQVDPESYEPIFKNAAESYLNEPYYVRQEVIDLESNEDPVRGTVIKHWVDRLEVDWFHCSSSREEKKPAKNIFYQLVKRIHDPRSSRAFWYLGSRCIFEGIEFVIAGVRSMVKVKWQGGSVEEINSTELVESKEFFVGQFVAKKEEKGVGFVRFVVDGIAWVKWVEEEKPELVHTSELQPHPEYRFQISDCVAEKVGSRARGFIVGMENGKIEVEWCLNKTITVVQPEEITRLCCFFGEDSSEEDEDEEGSSDDTLPPFLRGPVAISSSGSFPLELASSASDDDD
ncbi:hypothetical protein Bca52824_094362 [Brassica carinata]|uniref:Aminopeptidase N-like N-terminal domain-containing protein n=1 Tax=Brassica carinata TaxID=52824 RepID=A0A8X7TJ71_BRACI|nr:hypothetical protein Bca52824_094362 [Brassica carinata]